jgi:hypothetical protein
LPNFEHHWRKTYSDFPDNELIELVLRDVDLEYIPNFEARAGTGKRILLTFLFEEINALFLELDLVCQTRM